VFTGEFRHAVDDKGRVAIPVRFRDDLLGGGFVSKWVDGCVALYPRDAWQALADKAAHLPISDSRSREFQRFLFGAAFPIELDRQNRLVIPAPLREYAGLEAESVVVGLGDHLELWSPPRWAAYSARMNEPSELAEHLQGLGI
jgi:transcriptional regulator MraZ